MSNANRNRNKEKDHYTMLMEAQQKAIASQVSAEQNMKAQNIANYRAELDEQLHLQSQRLQSEIDDNRRWGEHQKNQQRALEDAKIRQNKISRTQKQLLKQEYGEMSKQKSMRKQVEANVERNDEKQRIIAAKKAEEKQKQDFQSINQKFRQQEQQVLQDKLRRKEQEKRYKEIEAEEDQQQAQTQIQAVTDRESAYKNYYTDVSKRINRRINVFKPITESEQRRAFEIDNKIRNNEIEYQQALDDKANREKMIRSQMQNETKAYLESQLQERQIKKEVERQTKTIEGKDMKRHIVQNNNFESLMKQQRRNDAKDYFEKLSMQAQIKREKDSNQTVMDNREQALHGRLIGGDEAPGMFTQVPGFHPRASPLGLALMGRKAHPTSQTPGHSSMMSTSQLGSTRSALKRNFSTEAFSEVKRQTANAFAFQFNPTRHNPITNPIGEPSIPRSNLNRYSSASNIFADAGNSVLSK